MNRIKQTHTYAILEISPSAFLEINTKLEEAGYHRAFQDDDGRTVIDMAGIAVAPEVYEPHRNTRENVSVLKMYILVNAYHSEYVVMLGPSEIESARFIKEDDLPTKASPYVVAVYKPTGRGPFKYGDGQIGYEYKYQGVRIMG